MKIFRVSAVLVWVLLSCALFPTKLFALDNLITLTGQWVDDRGFDNYHLIVTGNKIKIEFCPECMTKQWFEGEIHENHFYGKFIQWESCVKRQPNKFTYSAEGPVSNDGRTITLRYHMPIVEVVGCDAVYAKGSLAHTVTLRKK